ncbi:permease-like cell division protein FtsX [Maribrevibacterium harenarium]|nr:permease-like cell division protein FtsX [Maribrevibacterium harenarium]
MSKLSPRGATRQSMVQSKNKLKDSQPFSLAQHLRHHQSVLMESFARLTLYPLATVMTVLVIAIALSLPGALFVLLKNVESITDRWEQQSVIGLYLFSSLEDTEALALSHQLSSRADVERVDYISKEEGLRYFEQSSGYEDILSALPENPLPIVLQVIPKAVVSLETLPGLETLRADLEALPQVEYAQLDAQWLQRLASILAFGQRFIYGVSALLLVAVFLIVGNTIRTAVESRRDEVMVLKLVGATNAYIRRPFLYMGLWFGVLGGLCASVGIVLFSWWISQPAERLIALYQADFELLGFNLNNILVCIFISAIAGVIGAWISVGKHIRDMELQ